MLANISSTNNVSLDNICYLISKSFTNDEYMQQIEHETQLMRYCAEISVYSNEFFTAGQNGIKSSKAVIIDYEGYDNQDEIIYNGKHYAIYRTFPRTDGMIELYLSERSGCNV
jgi:SPP1 family predicted phage head-tail adaptor